jgi:hypothetical protein
VYVCGKKNKSGSVYNLMMKQECFRHCSPHCAANAKNKPVLEYLNADEEHQMFVLKVKKR